jgi:ABC-type branched-subunit amino acid transport system substrate-binding protein/predicted negative regulator of RcsB-dependent stress response
VEREFKAARSLFDNGEDAQAEAAFLKITTNHPDDPLARVSTIYRARIQLARDNPKKARSLLAPIKGDEDPVAERAAFYDGVALYKLKAYGEALSRLKQFVDRLTDLDENLLLLECLWKAASETGDLDRAVTWLDSYLKHAPPGDVREHELISLEGLVDEIDQIEQLEELGSSLEPNGSAWPLVMARLAKLQFESGELKKATQVLEKVDAQQRGDEQAIKDMASTIEKHVAVDFRSVGCIVPLSGRSRLIGEEVLKGVMLGAKALPMGEDNKLSVTIRDSGGDPHQAVKAVEELVFSEHVSAIVGPVDGMAALAAAERAEELQVPLLALSVRENLTEGRDFVFREFATNLAEVKALVDFATRQGALSFAISYPDNGYGRTMRGLMVKELKSRGIEPVKEVGYDPKNTAFVDMAKSLAQAEFDALFIPDRAGRIALLAPALAAAGLWSSPPNAEPKGPGRAIQLLFSSAGLDADLVRRAGRYLDGALFATFLNEQSSLGSSRFIERFRDEYKTEPSYLSGFGHDAAVLLAAAIRFGAKDRHGIRAWLHNNARKEAKSLPLAVPFAGFTKSGEPLAGPWLLRLDGDRFEALQ